MTDAERREKVIRGLEAHANPKTCETCDGEDCPYYNIGGSYTEVTCSSFLAADALALLKEQEARVMTLEELHPDLWIWMEYPGEEEGYDNYIGYAYLEGRMGYADLEGSIIEALWFLTAGAKERLVCPLKSYGQAWRVWTSRPTPEQMRDTKWEGEDNV